ncbi:fibrinogen alpha chain [Python bivittatus]|uniref:Fibrinogen alpha chain n=1 Tax=Python bivittatus TaxID=176946 RepID=A0A9F3QUU7_PYTBI|nr:fibrinogen alpha chain [Python bivittatus]
MFQLRILCALLCFNIALATDTGSSFQELGGGVRGPRIVEHKAQSDCKQDKEWPICADEDWGIRCPSGCRIQGLIDETNHDFQNRIEKIKKVLLDNQNSYKSSNTLKQEIFNYLERYLPSEQELDKNYGQITDDLRRRLVTLKQRVADKVQRIKTLQNSIQNQVGELKRLEVDIDIKIRACKGSCARLFNYNLDTESYGNLQKQLVQVNSINLGSEEEVHPLKALKITQVKDSTASQYKSGYLTEQEKNLLDSIKVFKVVLEDSKGSLIDTKYVSEVDTAGKLSTSSKAIIIPSVGVQTSRTCIKTITKKVIRGPDGFREEIVEEFKSPDGSDCSDLRDFIKEAGSYHHVSSGGGGSGSHDFAPQHPDADSGSISFNTESFSHTSKIQEGDTLSEIGEGEFDDFSRFEHSSHGGHSKTSSTSSHSKTVISSSSSTSAFNKGDSTFETKSRRILESDHDVEEVQHDENAEHSPDLEEENLNAEEKLGKGNIGTDCEDIHQKHTSGAQSGIFRITPAGSAKVFSVYCDQETTLGGWLLIQQRLDGSLNFNRTWEDYKKGFGSLDVKGRGEFWLGNENLHILTQEDTVLRVEIEDWEGNKAYAEYNIHVGSESEGYRLRVSDYKGTAGDALIKGSEEDGSEYTAHTNMKFSTFDQDSDQWEENCAEVYGGGWWYNNCQAANLNGIYYSGGQYDPRDNVPYEIENGVIWLPFRPSDYSLKVTQMKIRPVETD